jgi:cardiolipin synthase
VSEPRHHDPHRFDPSSTAPVRMLAEQVLSRAAGAPLVDGNRVRLLCDARENYPAWLDAIANARRVVLFENYIIQNDSAGQRFAEALIERARAGVRVCVIYDWFGGLGLGSRRLLKPLRDAGGEVRVFNPLSIASPLGWMQRDHRKMLAVDGQVGFVSGLCVGARWDGDPARGIAPWRDTGVEVTGPAVADLERAFAQVWAACGSPLPESLLTRAAHMPRAGNVTLRVLASQPYTAGLYRLDQLIASMATRTLWLTDAYYVGLAPYVRALRAAALDGVDVRLLVPGASNLVAVSTLSRVGYRTLLEAGVRVFEWNGPMLHAKTAVADGRWARVGSTNLNASSWLANHELDVAVEDAAFAGELESVYEHDLTHATEVLLSPRRRVLPVARRARTRGRFRGSASRAAAGALLIGNTVQAAISNQRLLGPAEAGIMGMMGLMLIVLVAAGLLWPLAIVLPLCGFGAWVGVSLLIRAYRLRREGKKNEGSDPPAT